MIVLTIGLSIAQIVLTELKTSSDAAASQQAYLAAESGLEEVALLLKNGNSIPTSEITLASGGKYYASSGNVFKNNICYQRLTVKGGYGDIVREVIKDDPQEINIIIAATVTVKDLYEKTDLSGVTTCGQANRGLGYGSGTYNPDSTNSTGYPIARNITIKSTGNLTTSDPSGSNPGQKIRLEAKNTLTIEAGGKIDASGKGYGAAWDSWGGATSAQGSDAGGNGGPADGGLSCSGGGGGGGAYGGNGGGGGNLRSSAGIGGSAYDNSFPESGSGGGSGGSRFSPTSTHDAYGGNGGGSIKIIAATFVVNGKISANGDVGNGQGLIYGTGAGGSGGSIYLISTRDPIDNAGNVEVKGGNGAHPGCGFEHGTYKGTGPAGGGGGGGRIKIKASSINGSPVVTGGLSGSENNGSPGSDGVFTFIAS